MRRPVWLVSCARDVREQPGIRISEERLNPAELLVWDGLWLTCPERSVLHRAAARDVPTRDPSRPGAPPVDLPPGWSDLSTVAARRKLDERQRERLLPGRRV